MSCNKGSTTPVVAMQQSSKSSSCNMIQITYHDQWAPLAIQASMDSRGHRSKRPSHRKSHCCRQLKRRLEELRSATPMPKSPVSSSAKRFKLISASCREGPTAEERAGGAEGGPSHDLTGYLAASMRNYQAVTSYKRRVEARTLRKIALEAWETHGAGRPDLSGLPEGRFGRPCNIDSFCCQLLVAVLVVAVVVVVCHRHIHNTAERTGHPAEA